MGLPVRMVSGLHVPPLFWQGRVKARLESGQFEVDCGERAWVVPVAVSCLVQPQAGDKVWVGGADGEQAYVFAVLERPQGGALHLVAEQGLHVQSNQGDIHISSAADLSLQSAGHLRQSGRELSLTTGTLRILAKMHETVADRLSQVCNHVFRLTEKEECWRGGRMDVQAQHQLRLHARHTLMTARELVKVDADQIHMG
ncbi:MAG TPA: DUF3540 domain-containing protein [Alcaligenes sp.]|nr:DUF3540 domain-containing protein [Alcaligenes sp.]HRL26075.1 DUF3540 domain-containing protein [Alcaligenes sp.]